MGDLGASAAFAAGSTSASLQRFLRKTSEYPNQPRTFSQMKIWLWVSIPGIIILTLIMMPAAYADYIDGTYDIWGLIILGLITGMYYVFFFYGIFRRWGVDEEKVWTRFGKIFYREIRFDEIDEFKTSYQRYILYAKGVRVNIDYNRFGYSLVYLCLAKELQKRKFDLPDKVKTDSPNWEYKAYG